MKRVAPLAGFRWRTRTPVATSRWSGAAGSEPPGFGCPGENRARILAYNEDDVEATAAIREWRSEAQLPRVDSFD